MATPVTIVDATLVKRDARSPRRVDMGSPRLTSSERGFSAELSRSIEKRRVHREIVLRRCHLRRRGTTGHLAHSGVHHMSSSCILRVTCRSSGLLHNKEFAACRNRVDPASAEVYSMDVPLIRGIWMYMRRRVHEPCRAGSILHRTVSRGKRRSKRVGTLGSDRDWSIFRLASKKTAFASVSASALKTFVRESDKRADSCK